MSVPKYFELHRPFLDILSDGHVYAMKELRSILARKLQLSDQDLSEMLPSGRQTVFANRITWAGTYLLKAGLIEKPARATFIITATGLEALKTGPEVIDTDYLLRFDSFKTFLAGDSTKKAVGAASEPTKQKDETPDDIFESAFKTINRNLQDDLLSEIMKLSPAAFEQMVLDLMAKMGYGTFVNSSKTTSVSGDEGIDGVIMQDKLGFDLIYIQAKKWKKDQVVGRPEIQAFVGAIAGKGGQGLFVTTSKFSKQAIEYASKQHIILMDGERLTEYMIEYNFGVTVKKTFEIKTVDTDIFNDYDMDGESF